MERGLRVQSQVEGSGLHASLQTPLLHCISVLLSLKYVEHPILFLLTILRNLLKYKNVFVKKYMFPIVRTRDGPVGEVLMLGGWVCGGQCSLYISEHMGNL